MNLKRKKKVIIISNLEIILYNRYNIIFYFLIVKISTLKKKAKTKCKYCIVLHRIFGVHLRLFSLYSIRN